MNLPYGKLGDLFNVKISGRYVTVQTSFGLEVSYDGYYYISVGLKKRFQGNVEGTENTFIQLVSCFLLGNAIFLTFFADLYIYYLDLCNATV